jgi:hypothetical protein
MGPSRPSFARCAGCGATFEYDGSRSGNTFGGVTCWSDGILEGPMLARPAYECYRCPSCAKLVWIPQLTSWFDGARDHGALSVWVDLRSMAARRVEVIHAIRRATDLGVAAARELVSSGAFVVVPSGSAADLAAALAALGATARVRARAGDRAGTAIPTTAVEVIELAEATRDQPAELAIRLEAWTKDNAPFRDGAPWVSFAERPPVIRANLERVLALTPPSDEDQAILGVEILRQLERFDEARALLATARAHRWFGRYEFLLAGRVAHLVRL